MKVKFRWLSRRDRRRGVEVHHVVDVGGDGAEKCGGEGDELIQGSYAAGSDDVYYCVECLRRLIQDP